MATNARANKAANAKTAPAATAISAEDAETKALKVVPKRAGFRRAGYTFPYEGLTIPIADITPKQYEQITTEPMLIAVIVDMPADGVSAEGEKSGAEAE